MQTTKYLIVGAGMTGDMAAKGIREHDADGRVVIVGAESNPVYKRPLLTKGLWSGAPEEKLWKQPADNVDFVTGRRIVSVDLDGHRATDDAGEEYGWEKLLLATGASPRQIPGADGVIWFRTLDDYRAVREKATEGAHVVVIGGGFIGSEIAAALVGAGVKVTMVFPEPGIGFRLFPIGLAEFLVDFYREKGIEVLSGETVSAASGTSVTLGDGRVLEADCVVAGLGVIPETGLAEAAGLEVEDGIVVDEYGRASGREDVFAAGDVARFPVAALGTMMRVEHEDHANTHGKTVGANMAGAARRYDHLPLFYSDLFDLGYEAVGQVDSRLEAVEEWQEPFRKGVVTYVEDGKPRGVLLWNVWDRVDDARGLIRSGEGTFAL
ncbi:MAG: 3-phenylpropionate/trans-cinnamate dioxygenase ferredoxin reductase component [Gaiellaceae bacterium]|jgi:NADPH-dependent 2,4-dienoyl-CoA reductase/sulfur reductase-like enzyme|nr:3-phenylpropionate/trans-cinnamate dioxygenase ferredoxin reductase component [Gaiellaceae bacterium]